MEVPLNSMNREQMMAHRPKTLVCHICGREFGTKSLAIHLETCKEKKQIEEGKKRKNERRPIPELDMEIPDGRSREDVEAYNQAARAVYEHQSMVQCPNCSRRFVESALVIHLRSCTAENPHKALNRKEEISQPRTQPDLEELKVRSSASAKPGKIRIPLTDANTESAEFVQIALVKCTNCGRNFAEDRLSKHEAICFQSQHKEKKVFKSSAQRIVDPIMINPTSSQEEEKKNPGKWKREHEDFVNAMKYTKKVKEAEKTGRDVRSIEAPVMSGNNDFVQCPYCTRKFAPQTAERHIPKCKDIVNKPKPPPNRLAATLHSQIPDTPARLSKSPQPNAQRNPISKSPSRPVLSKSSTEAVFKKETVECERCGKSISAVAIESHLKICGTPKKTGMSNKLAVPGTSNGLRNSQSHSPSARTNPEAKELARSAVRTPEKGVTQEPRLRLFCHMCGAKYYPDALFCAYCGVKK